MHDCSSERRAALAPKSAQGLVSSKTALPPALLLLVEPHGNMRSPEFFLEQTSAIASSTSTTLETSWICGMRISGSQF